MIEEADSRLIGFFDMMVNALIPITRSAYNKEEAKKKIVAICYIMAAQRNMFANEFVLNIGLFLDSTGSTNEAIDAMHKIRVSVCAKTVDLHKTKIAQNHKLSIKEYFQTNVSILYSKYIILIIIIILMLCFTPLLE